MRKGVAKKLLLIFIILFFCLLCLLILLTNTLKKEETAKREILENNVSTESVKQTTVKDIIEKYESKYILAGVDFIEVVLSKNLFNEDGTSNKAFIDSLVKELIPFYTPKDFYLMDKEKNIEIYARYDKTENGYEILINKVEDFYDKVNGEAYLKVDESEIVDGTSLAVTDDILLTLTMNNDKFDGIKKYLDEGTEVSNGYTAYNNGTIKIRTVPTGSVKNLIFTEDYEGEITYKINTDMSLREISEAEPHYDFGSVQDGYLGYRNNNFYLFFYKDEVSVYTYSYKYNGVFEDYLDEYLETGDLKTFVNNLSVDWRAYDSFEYNPDTQSAKILYSTRGVDIDIKNNDATGITLYSNYCFSENTRQYVKKGLISFKPGVDLVEKTEIKRRDNY